MRLVRHIGRGVRLLMVFGVTLPCTQTRLLFAQGNAKSSTANQSGEWVAYGHDPLGSRFSPLAQITKDNVAQLTVAWTYRTNATSGELRGFDHVLRAFDVVTGKELWKGPLPGGARATPMTYQLSPHGRQFVVIAVGGGDDWGKGDYVVAFALPR